LLLAEPQQQHVHARRVDVGQLGQIADPHQHLRRRVSTSNLQVAAQTGRQAKPDRLQNGVDAKWHRGGRQEFDVLVQTRQRTDLVRDDDHFAAPIPRRVAVRPIHGQHQLGPGPYRRLDFRRIPAVYRHTVPVVPQSANAIRHAKPGLARLAAHIDQVGSVVGQLPGLAAHFIQTQTRSVVNLCQDLYVTISIRVLQTGATAKEFRQLPQIPGAQFDGDGDSLGDRPQVAGTVAGQQDPRRFWRRLDMPRDPGGRHQGGHRNRHYAHRILEPDRLGQ